MVLPVSRDALSLKTKRDPDNFAEIAKELLKKEKHSDKRTPIQPCTKPETQLADVV